MADTTYTSVPNVSGTDNTVEVGEIEEQTLGIYLPAYVDNTVHVDNENVQGTIRATAYPYLSNDTVMIDLPIEFNLEPKPITQITRTDTLKIVDSVWIPTVVPFLEEPVVVATGVSLGWLLLLLILI
jgi:hypothetical protein